ncbi:MAG: hypothetical protein AAF518_20505, partial [Spirochaetota bacterium]
QLTKKLETASTQAEINKIKKQIENKDIEKGVLKTNVIIEKMTEKANLNTTLKPNANLEGDEIKFSLDPDAMKAIVLTEVGGFPSKYRKNLVPGYAYGGFDNTGKAMSMRMEMSKMVEAVTSSSTVSDDFKKKILEFSKRDRKKNPLFNAFQRGDFKTINVYFKKLLDIADTAEERRIIFDNSSFGASHIIDQSTGHIGEYDNAEQMYHSMKSGGLPEQLYASFKRMIETGTVRGYSRFTKKIQKFGKNKIIDIKDIASLKKMKSQEAKDLYEGFKDLATWNNGNTDLKHLERLFQNYKKIITNQIK